ncbi:aldose 1-epimerase [Acrasis kona]|uniref:Aldose 1-epimerase n=1 Tax=Acrasis kona TaxID=1008807 RepID=A0AAW2ZAT4_9EUKA
MDSDFATIRYKNQVAVISKKGGGIAQYYIEKDGEKKHFIYGYDSAESQGQNSGMGDVLSPWPGRLGDQKYNWNGSEYDVTGGVPSVDDNNNALHGYVRNLKWDVKVLEELGGGSATANVVLDEQKGYPFKLSYQIYYEMIECGLNMHVKVTNIGDKDAPFGLGHHPYFTIDCADVDDLELLIPSSTMVEFDSTKKPTGKLINVAEESKEYNFTTFKKIGDLVLDNCFTSCRPSVRERSVSGEKNYLFTSIRLKDKVVSMSQDLGKYPYIQVYTFDGSKKGHKRKAIALEPMTCCGFAFNEPDLGLINLKPGEEFDAEWGISVHSSDDGLY